MSREEKEKLLNEKMENIRKRNEELRKRHEEIEADKKNADKFSSTVTMDKVKPYVMKTPRPRTERSEKHREGNAQPPIPRPSDIMPSRQRLSEDDGPPPDPSYRFLSDPDRDGSERDRKRDGRGRNRGRHGSKGQHEKEGDNVEELEPSTDDSSFGGEHGGSNRKEQGKQDQHFNQKHGMGRGRGRRGGGFGRERTDWDGDHGISGEGMKMARDGQNNADKGKEKGNNFTFASRDIRYYPEDEDHQQKFGRYDKGQGRQNYSHWRHSEGGGGGGGGGGSPGHGKRNSGYRGKGRGRREYEKWKAEREAIDEARLTRGKTDGGSWRREWDHDKMNQGETVDCDINYDPRPARNKKKVAKFEKDKKPQDEQLKIDSESMPLDVDSEKMESPQHKPESSAKQDEAFVSDADNEVQEVIYIDDSSSDEPSKPPVDGEQTTVMD
ncbi:hypothetical protein SK128_011363 [Halocaridina rubra]|uniref:Uncharacterized protein n=1 Tax=Halocaridina rubra TaxID=373956 RepID=A0AAN8ZYB8_HALRR